MRNPQNIQELVQLPIDIIGFIFYEKSPRFVGEKFSVETRNSIPEHIQTAGVFVNASKEYIVQKVIEYSLQYIQLHGDETPEFCSDIKLQSTAKIIKAIQIDSTVSIEHIRKYSSVIDYFLFDTKSLNYGGTGKKFDWNILENLDIDKPFFLSGGISNSDIADIQKIQKNGVYAIDINSKFEIEPGVKDCKRIQEFILKIK